jgi:type IX secretion system PorP/SprF family membrane protein
LAGYLAKSRITAIVFMLAFTTAMRGQSDSSRITLGNPVYSQYLHNGLMINPAYAGSREALSAVASYRLQWISIPDAPRLYTLSLHTPLKNDKVGIGIKAQRMEYGVTLSHSIHAIYSYHIRLGTGKLSFGISGGADMSNTDYSLLKGIAPGDNVFATNDKPYILANAGAGVYYFSNRFFIGASVPEFLSHRNLGNGETQIYHSFNNYDFVISGGGLISFSQAFKFKPSVLLSYSPNKTKQLSQLDINGNFIFGDVLWVGGSYRTTEEVFVGHLQVQLSQQLMVGLSYDYPAGRMTSYSQGSGEIVLRYEFGSKISAANPRYF